MPYPVAHFHPRTASEPPDPVKSVTRQDVLWDRPVFKAPPLAERPTALDVTALASDLLQLRLVQR